MRLCSVLKRQYKHSQTKHFKTRLSTIDPSPWAHQKVNQLYNNSYLLIPRHWWLYTSASPNCRQRRSEGIRGMSYDDKGRNKPRRKGLTRENVTFLRYNMVINSSNFRFHMFQFGTFIWTEEWKECSNNIDLLLFLGMCQEISLIFRNVTHR
jgi:hypothetical protein